MAALSENDRVLVWAQWMRENNILCTITKTELRAAINAIDDWADSNSAEFNSAIPQPARSALTAKQKAWLLANVIRRRFEIS